MKVNATVNAADAGSVRPGFDEDDWEDDWEDDDEDDGEDDEEDDEEDEGVVAAGLCVGAPLALLEPGPGRAELSLLQAASASSAVPNAPLSAARRETTGKRAVAEDVTAPCLTRLSSKIL